MSEKGFTIIVVIALFFYLYFNWRSGQIRFGEVAKKYKRVTPGAAKILWDRGATFVDVRSPEEFHEVHIAGAINIPVEEILKGAELPDRDKETVLYCRSGARSKNAITHLIRRGYTNLYDLGMLDVWNGPVEWPDDDANE